MARRFAGRRDDLEAEIGEECNRPGPNPTGRASDEHWTRVGSQSTAQQRVDRGKGGESSGADRHRGPRSHLRGSHHDPVGGNGRHGGEAAVVADAEAVTVDDGRRANGDVGMVRCGDPSGEVHPANEWILPSDAVAGDGDHGIFEVAPRPLDGDHDVADER